MADNNKLSLVVEIDVNKANASIKTVNVSLSSIEQAAAKAARGASTGIDGMTASMMKGAAAGNLIADAFRTALEWAKAWTFGAVEHAAHTEKLTLSMNALAKAHNITAEAANASVESVKKIGYETQDAVHAVNRLMIADMDLSKAEGLAKLAKDAAAIENITPGEGLEKLLLALESGASRGLRTMGIIVDLNKVVERQEKLTGRSLTENEVLQLRYNTVMAEGAKIQGAAAAAQGSAEAQAKALAREVTNLKDAIGTEFQGLYKEWLKNLLDLTHYLRDNSDVLVKFAEGVGVAAGLLATYAIATKIEAITIAFRALSIATAMNPVGLVVMLGVAGAAALTKSYLDMKEQTDQQYEDMRRQAIQKNLFSGKMKPDDVKKMGYTDDQIKEIVSGKRLMAGETWGDLGNLGFPKLNIAGGAKHELSDADVDRIATERKKRGEAERSAQELYMRTVEERKGAEHDMARARIEDSMKIIESTHSESQAAREALNVAILSAKERTAGIEKIAEEERREIQQRSTYTDEKSGAVRHFKLDPSTLATIHNATLEKLAAFDMKFNEEESRRVEAIWKAATARLEQQLELHNRPILNRIAAYGRVQELVERGGDAELTYQRQAIEQRKELELAQLDAVDARTLQQKVALENAKTAIEVQAMKARTEIELQEIDRRAAHDIEQERRAAIQRADFDPANLKLITDKIEANAQQEREALQSATANSVDVAQAKGAIATRKIVVDQYQSIFQSLKQQAGGVFDALLQKSQSVWSAIGNSLKTALLTAIKDVVTSRVAAMLMNMFVPGAHAQMQQGGGTGGGSGGGLLGMLGIGAVPVFAGTGGGGGIPGVGGGAGGLGNILLGAGGAAVGGTPPFLPSGSAGGAGIGAATPPAAGGIFSKAGLAGMLPGLKSMFGFGNVSKDSMGGMWSTVGNQSINIDSLGGKLQALGKSNAALMAGAGLAIDGLKRGGYTGMAETTAGGAMIGYKFGGPLGAAIGAVVGLEAGIVRMFIKGAAEKAKEKIKALYGVDIKDKGVLQQIVDTAKSGFGGNLDMAIRSQQVRDLIQLYAMTTGQKVSGMPGSVTPLSLSQMGGSLFQSPQYNNGAPLPVLGGLPSLDQVGGGVASNAGGTIVIPLQIDSTAVGNVVIQDGRVVAQGAITAMKSNAGRRELTALQLSPGTLVT